MPSDDYPKTDNIMQNYIQKIFMSRAFLYDVSIMFINDFRTTRTW